MPRARADDTPLDELKELLRRTSHVERALGRLDATDLAGDATLRVYARRCERDTAASTDTEPDTEVEALRTDSSPFRSSSSVQPLSNVETTALASLAKCQQAEEAWQRERIQLRREADSQRRRASALEHRHSQLQSLHKHQGTEVRALKAALQQREARADGLERQLEREHEDAAAAVSAFERQITGLKGGGTPAEEREELQRLLGAALEKVQSGGRSAAVEAEASRAAAAGSEAWKLQALQRVFDMQLCHARQGSEALSQTLHECGVPE